MNQQKTKGILLRQTLLANDDALLEFFTDHYGKIIVSVKKFSTSRKRAQEIDFFRLLELEIFEGRNSKSLRGVSTLAIFPKLNQSFEISERAFSWLAVLRKVLPEEKPAPILFETMTSLFQKASVEFIEHFDLFFRVVILNFLGFLTRFDSVRGNCFFSPSDFQFSSSYFSGAQEISNDSRQIIEFLRRSDFDEFFEKKEKLPVSSFREVSEILLEIERYHL